MDRKIPADSTPENRKIQTYHRRQGDLDRVICMVTRYWRLNCRGARPNQGSVLACLHWHAHRQIGPLQRMGLYHRKRP